MAAWNAVLRPAVDLAVTPYYIFSPFLAIYLFCKVSWVRSWCFIFFLFATYGLVIGGFYGVPALMQLTQILKYAQLLIFFGLMSFIFRLDKNGPGKLQSIVFVLTLLVFSLLYCRLLLDLSFQLLRMRKVFCGLIHFLHA